MTPPTPRRRVTNEDLANQLDEFRADYKRSSLNGEAKTLRELAKVAPQLHVLATAAPHLARLAEKSDALVQLADKSSALVEVAGERLDREGASRTLRRITGWTPGTGWGCAALVISGLIVSLFGWWASHGFHF